MGYSKTANNHQSELRRGSPDLDDAASASSAVLLRDHDFLEHDSEPPPYAETPSDVDFVSSTPPTDLDRVVEEYTHVDDKGSTRTRLSPTLTTDPVALEKYIRWTARQAPKATIRVRGTHHERERTKNNGAGKKVVVVDFDVDIDASDTISRNFNSQQGFVLEEWSRLELLQEETKGYRGGRIKARGEDSRDTEARRIGQTLNEWCHLFCASTSMLKSFALECRVVDRDEALITSRLTSYILSTNYRGHISIAYTVSPHTTVITTPHPLNRLRHNNFVYWACIILQLWIFTWPILWFMTRRWSVVHADWPYQVRGPDRNNPTGAPRWQYVKESEEHWCRRWKYTVTKAAETRWQGALEREWIAEAEGLSTTPAQPTNGFVAAAVGLVRGISGVLSEEQRRNGWGADSL
ncbi:hypothetical protein MMC11_001355 [Xylographa trunciseda]|nr:hypothetical protein [Xylographa trunciseda]